MQSCCCVCLMLQQPSWSPNAGLKWVDDRLQSRISYGNYLAGFLAVVGGYVVYSAFNDPDSGKFERDIPFSNWSATHTVKCKCEPNPHPNALAHAPQPCCFIR